MIFDSDSWQELWAVTRRNKLRTFLTALGVFWGVFMLIVMVGVGRGLENGVTGSMRGFATNSVYVWAQRTSVPYQGLPPGRRIKFTNEDIEPLRQIPGIEHLAPRNKFGGWDGGNIVTYKDKSHAFSVNGDFPVVQRIEMVDLLSGRHLNDLDMTEQRKIAVIGHSVQKFLFGDEDPLRKTIKVDNIYFEVVGVFKTLATGEEAEEKDSTIYVPFTTFQQVFHENNSVGWFALTVKPDYTAPEIEAQVKETLALQHRVAPKDPRAFGSFNAQEEFAKITGLFTGIRVLIWVVGVITLLAGVLGVSNIMLISVKERTKEIGIRKALGATPAKIIVQIVQESVALTSIAGYLGVVTGVLLLEGVNLLTAGEGTEMFKNPQIDIRVALVATAVLIVSGALAGIIPARNASKVNPVIALRAE
jgi:putative ABC transport system permease protein